jgi:hypothetical protein
MCRSEKTGALQMNCNTPVNMSIFLLRKIDIYYFIIFDMFLSQTRYDIDPLTPQCISSAEAHIERRRRISKIPSGIYIEGLLPKQQALGGYGVYQRGLEPLT